MSSENPNPARAAFRVTRVELGPDDLQSQVPLTAELHRFMPGPDRPDYALAVVKDHPIRFKTTQAVLVGAGVNVAAADPQLYTLHEDGTVDLQVWAVVVTPRVAGERLYQGMKDLAVGIAYVVDNTLMRDERLDFSKVFYAAVAVIEDATPGA
ncbi:hypothetical protein [Homoserinibacter sp. YIM 151385]|uniref:hypothetical protein n=1 Tax=Homoserinibacter sp. YIM 151385 TaxID=2985506 RepID=UPI0022F04AAB|nr:hypothetical protein [Homoserinibacter sp. YIM 151385]WBU37345.1 hypothetical protein OF852_10520 [Homoserinibacter sp. YIM 151385]